MNYLNSTDPKFIILNFKNFTSNSYYYKMQVQELITKDQSIAFTVLDDSMTLNNPACPPERIQKARNFPSREALTEKLVRAEQKRIEMMTQHRGVTDNRVQAAQERRQRYNNRGDKIMERVRIEEAQAATNRLLR